MEILNWRTFYWRRVFEAELEMRKNHKLRNVKWKFHYTSLFSAAETLEVLLITYTFMKTWCSCWNLGILSGHIQNHWQSICVLIFDGVQSFSWVVLHRNDKDCVCKVWYTVLLINCTNEGKRRLNNWKPQIIQVSGVFRRNLEKHD